MSPQSFGVTVITFSFLTQIFTVQLLHSLLTRKEKKKLQRWSTYVGWSSQAFAWWLLELFDELPRSKTHTQKDLYVLTESLKHMHLTLLHYFMCVWYSLCPLGKGWVSWNLKKIKKEVLTYLHESLCYYMTLHSWDRCHDTYNTSSK